MAIGIYARVSTAGQLDGTSLEGQVGLCKAKAKELGDFDSNILIYREEGRSGEDIDTRLALTKMRDDVAAGLVSTVICTHPDRFSRDLADKLIVCQEFEKYGVTLVFTDTQFSDTDEGKLFFNVMSSIASYEMSLIRKRTVRGRLQKVKNDKKIMPMRVAPFGYKKDAEGQLIVNQMEKRYVQMIYEWYVKERLTMREIGDRLYKLDVKPKRGESSNWSASSIKRILTSEIYIGKYYYNRRATKKVKGKMTEGGNPKKTYTIRPKEDWLEIDVEPIVNDEIWKLAQDQRDINNKNKHVGNKKNQYLLKSLLKCYHCKRTYQATTYTGRKNKETGEKQNYRCYRCPNKFPKKYGPEVLKCEIPSFRAELIEDYIWSMVIEIISKPENFVSRLKGNTEDSLSVVRDNIILLEKELKLKTSALEKVELAIFETDEQETIDRYTKYIENYKKGIRTLKAEIIGYQDKINDQRREELTVEQIQYSVLNLKEKLTKEDVLSFEVKRNIIEMLFEEIFIEFETDEKFKITSVGLFDVLSRKNDVGVKTQPQEV